MNLAIVTSIAAFAVCSCNQRQQEARASKELRDSPAQTSEELHSSNERVTKIEGWDIGIVGSGPDKRYIEWTSKKPITEMQAGDALVSNDWGFVVLDTGIFEWPSMKPIEAGISPKDQINQDDMPPIPNSSWSRKEEAQRAMTLLPRAELPTILRPRQSKNEEANKTCMATPTSPSVIDDHTQF